MFSLNPPAFSMIQRMLTIWSLVLLPFLNPDWTSGSSQFMYYCWSLASRILSITLLACEMSTIVQQFEHSLASPFFGFGMKTDLFQSCGHCLAFQICWHIECSTFTASSFRIWNNSTGTPAHPLAFIIVMLPKAHLISHSRMSDSRWEITPLWLSGLWRSFLYSYSVYSCHLFLISSASVSDTIQPSHPLSSPSPPLFNLSQHQCLFQWVSSSYHVAKVLEFQLHHQSFQWIFKDWFPLG